ncbi:MAG TPA: glutathione S-transferase family protein [Candidatus Binataceae bacterium]|nr:glutathione S-transferase family protein [Candidatus Binataceae bacterium]
MRLFTFATSPYARKVRMALDFKGIAYEPVERCYSLDHKADLLTANPRAEVPALILDDGRTIADSTIICEYLEDTFPEPSLRPGDPYERARMRQIEDLCDRAFDAVTYGYWIAEARKTAPESDRMKAAARAEFEALLKKLEGELGDRDFFCGAISIADLAAICHVPAARAIGIDLHKMPHLRRWSARMTAIPAVKGDRDRLVAALSKVHDITSELEGPDGKVHWRDSRLEWPVRHGFFEFVAREFGAGKMMFPPDGT